MSVICLNCEGWGCLQCKNEREAAQGGEQGLSPLEVEVEGLRAKVAHLEARVPHHPFDVRCADALADEVAVLVRRGIIDARSPAADALLDYRNPPPTERSDRLWKVEAERDRLLAELALLRVPGGKA